MNGQANGYYSENDKEIVMDDFSKFMNVPTGDPEEVPFEGSYVVEKQ